jgi:hypothetical protein
MTTHNLTSYHSDEYIYTCIPGADDITLGGGGALKKILSSETTEPISTKLF